MSLAKLSFNSRALSILVCWTRKWLRVRVKIAVPIRVEIGINGEGGGWGGIRLGVRYVGD